MENLQGPSYHIKLIHGSCHDLCNAPLKSSIWATSEEPVLTARDMIAGTFGISQYCEPARTATAWQHCMFLSDFFPQLV